MIHYFGFWPLYHCITLALTANGSWATIPNNTAAYRKKKVKQLTEKTCLAFINQPKGLTGAKILRNSHIFLFGMHHRKDGNPLRLLSGCCRRYLFTEKRFPISWMRFMLPFGANFCLFLQSVSTPRVVPLMEIFQIFLVLVTLFYFPGGSPEVLMTFVILEYLSGPTFSSFIKRDLIPFHRALTSLLWAELIL